MRTFSKCLKKLTENIFKKKPQRANRTNNVPYLTYSQKFTFCIAMYLMRGDTQDIFLTDPSSPDLWMDIYLDIDTKIYDKANNTFQGAFGNIFA